MGRKKGVPNIKPSAETKRDLMRKLRGSAEKGDPIAIGFVLLLDAVHHDDKKGKTPRPVK